MTSLFVDRKGVELAVESDALVFRAAGERLGTVPVAPLTRVYLRGDVTLHANVLGKLGERGVGVVVLSGRAGKPVLLMGAPSADAARRIRQYERSLDAGFCLCAARELVRARLESQHRLLGAERDRDLAHRYELGVRLRTLGGALAALDSTESGAAMRGVEGAAGAAFFAGYAVLVPPAFRFASRNRRPPRDPVNVLLSLTYTLLHCEAVLAAHGAGLDPFVGFYHVLDHGRESLACDLAEPFRAEAEAFVLQLVRGEVLRLEHFTIAAGACLMGKAGRARYYEAVEPLLERIRRGLTHAARTIVGWLESGVVSRIGASEGGDVPDGAAAEAAHA